MKKILAIVVALFWLEAPAQDKVKITGEGVEVESGKDRVKITTEGVEAVESGGTRVKITAPQVEASTQENAAGEQSDTAADLPEVPPQGLKKIPPIVCQSNKDQEYTRVLIVGKKDGVLVQGNCDIILRDSHIDVEGYGVNVQGNGNVKLIRTFVRGKKGAVMIMGNGDVSASSSTLVGPIKQMGNGEFTDQGNNTIRKH